MTTIKNYAPAIGWGIFIFILSTLPGKDFPQIPHLSDLFSLDKVVHMAFYAILTSLILRGWLKQQNPQPSPKSIRLVGFLAALFSLSMGWFLEWYQETFCEDRLFEFLDGIANSIGALLAWIIFSFKNRS